MSWPCRAERLSVDLRGPGGQGVADAVVSFVPASGVKAPWRLDTPREMKQQDIAFVPHVLVVPVGADVVFPNMDRVRHHVYSFSKAKRFELKLYGQEQTRSVHFDKPGIVAVGCNIHDRMSGFIDVVDTPYAAKTDAAGHAVLVNVPDGSGVLTIWAEALKTPQNTQSEPLTVRGDTHRALTLDLKPALPAMGMDRPG